MVISHKYKFIFIKTAKTAGTSIEIFLSQHCGESDIFTPIHPQVEPHRARNYAEKGFYNHMPAREVQPLVPDQVWNNYFKFCVERNPWDKTLSNYHMLKHRAGGGMSLEEYFSSGKCCLNIEKYTDESGKNMLDRIVKYEVLDEELGEVFSHLGIPFGSSLEIRAKSEYRSDRKHYRDILSSAQAELIATTYEREIAMHGYCF